MVRIYKGDDVNFADRGEVVVRILTPLDLEGFTGTFVFMGVTKQFSAEQVASKTFLFVYSAEETSTFCLGRNFGTFTLFDPKGRKAVISQVLVEVVPSSMCISSSSSNCVFVTMDNIASYGGLANKPKINGVTVEGDNEGRHYRLNKILPFSEDSAYAKGDQVCHENAFWECKSDAVEPGPWNQDAWARIGATDIIVDPEPQKDSPNAVASGGVWAALNVLAQKDNPTIGDIAAALGWAGEDSGDSSS